MASSKRERNIKYRKTDQKHQQHYTTEKVVVSKSALVFVSEKNTHL